MFYFSQTLDFPLDYGLCSCSAPADPSCSALGLCGTTVIEDLFADAVVPSASAATLEQSVLENTAYSFTGGAFDQNWIEVSDQTKEDFFNHVDNQPFTISFWIIVDATSASSYIFSFETGNMRYFSLYESSRTRAILYYFRDTLDNLEQFEDTGYNTQVALSFFYPSVFPDGLRDNGWHFIALSVDYPSISLTVDGYVIRSTQGNYFDSTDTRVNLANDGTLYNMPAPILVKDQAMIDSLTGYIGGSSGRGTRYAFDGSMRQLILTDPLSTDAYNCLGSCDVTIYPDNSISGFNTFYNPAQRSFEFSSSAASSVSVGDTEYTQFMGTLIFSDNGFLPPEEQGESWRVSVQVRRNNTITLI